MTASNGDTTTSVGTAIVPRHPALEFALHSPLEILANGPVLGFDIETVATTEFLAQPYPEDERQPPANYKNEEAIANWRTKDREVWAAERHKEGALDPLKGRVVAIGMAWTPLLQVDELLPFDIDGDTAPMTVSMAAHEAVETRTLQDLWRLVQEATLITSFAGAQFDLPFCVSRSLILGVTIPNKVRAMLRKYSTRPHFDTKEVLTNWQPKKGHSLDAWAKALGFPTKPGVTGADVAGLVANEQWNALALYAAHDACTTLGIAAKLAPFHLTD